MLEVNIETKVTRSFTLNEDQIEEALAEWARMKFGMANPSVNLKLSYHEQPSAHIQDTSRGDAQDKEALDLNKARECAAFLLESPHLAQIGTFASAKAFHAVQGGMTGELVEGDTLSGIRAALRAIKES